MHIHPIKERSMNEIKFSKHDTDRIISKVKTYIHDELGQEIGGFEAQFLIDFLAKEI